MCAKKVEIYDLAIETTRRCNMKCAHCLRGNAQSLDIDIAYVDKLFEQVSYISSITLSGGEPSMVPGILKQILDSAKRHNIAINGFYCATNGKVNSPEFTLAIMEWYLYCEEKEACYVDISRDKYHDKIDTRDLYIKALNFCGTRGEDSRYENLIDQGRAKINNLGTRWVKEDTYTVEESWNSDNIVVSDGVMYLNAKGLLVKGCDWSYGNQHKHAIGHVNEVNLYEWAQSLLREQDSSDIITRLPSGTIVEGIML